MYSGSNICKTGPDYKKPHPRDSNADGNSRDHLVPSVPRFTIFFYTENRSSRYIRNDDKFLPGYRNSQPVPVAARSKA